MAQQMKDCAAVASCLRHNLNVQGNFGLPRLPVTKATRRLCEAIKPSYADLPVRFVLVNTTGNRNRGRAEPISFVQMCVLGLLRVLLCHRTETTRGLPIISARRLAGTIAPSSR